MSGTYQLPFGKGKSYFSTVPKWVDEVIGGWSTSQIFYWMSGDLLSFPDVRHGLRSQAEHSERAYWFNPNCITTPPSYTMATAPPYYQGLRGPRFWQLDSTASKTFNINERFNLEFRLEMYNMPNKLHPRRPLRRLFMRNVRRPEPTRGRRLERRQLRPRAARLVAATLLTRDVASLDSPLAFLLPFGSPGSSGGPKGFSVSATSQVAQALLPVPFAKSRRAETQARVPVLPMRHRQECLALDRPGQCLMGSGGRSAFSDQGSPT